MSNKAGSVSENGMTGTQEEFYLVLGAIEKGDPIDGCFFFKSGKVAGSQSLDEAQSLTEVAKFRDAIKDKALFQEWDDTSQLVNKVVQKISTHKIFFSAKVNEEAISRHLEDEFLSSQKCYKSIKYAWTNRTISTSPEHSSRPGDEDILTSSETFCENLNDCILVAPTQFGITTLGRRFALDAWEKNRKFLAFFDSRTMPSHESGVADKVESYLAAHGLNINLLDGIILDSELTNVDKRRIKNLKKLFPRIPLLVMLSVPDNVYTDTSLNGSLGGYEVYYLWALEREQLRNLVSQVLSQSEALVSEDEIVNQIVDCFSNLNLHRTPLNTLQLITIFENQLKAQPENRADIFESFLQIVFLNHKTEATYSRTPSIKDANHVLGPFCADLFNKKKMEFSKQEFKEFTAKTCSDVGVDIDIEMLFQILLDEKILLQTKAEAFQFRYALWIYYFVARHIHQNGAYREAIFSSLEFLEYPELIEFYSGTDLQRNDLIELLSKRMKDINKLFEDRTGIPDDFTPFDVLRWEVPHDALIQIEKDINDTKMNSNLPVEVKDVMADKKFDRSKPYIQEIDNFISDSSLREGLQIAKSALLALRNSDWAKKDAKIELLEQVFNTWKKMAQIICLFGREFAEHKFLFAEGIFYQLDKSFDDYSGEELLERILVSIPANIESRFGMNLGSPRMGSFLAQFAEQSDCLTEKYFVSSNVLRTMPLNWESPIHNFVEDSDRNSFLLGMLLERSLFEMKYGFFSTSGVEEKLRHLQAMIVSKHRHKSTTKKAIKKTKMAIDASEKIASDANEIMARDDDHETQGD